MTSCTDEELLKLLGERIRNLRKVKGMSQQDLAYVIGIEKSNLSVIENGKTNPQILTYAKIASAMEMSLDNLFQVEFDFKSFLSAPSKYQARKHK
jgi:transcriptional regulator with XRE-family HTH domain